MEAKKISDQVMDNVEILAKLDLTKEERKKAKEEMEKILTYVEKLGELDTDDVEPLIHILLKENVFREDHVTNGNRQEEILANAPKSKNGQFQVPKTV